jgi:hypothetical protein
LKELRRFQKPSLTSRAAKLAPTLGQHTIEVLTAELGYSKPEVVILRQRNIV